MYKQEFKINLMCRILGVSRSGYYRRSVQEDNPREQALRQEIQRVFKESRRSYGSPRIYQQLKSEGIQCGRHRVARFMREEDLVARKKRQYKKPVSLQRGQALADNILDRKFNTTSRNSVWACDVSYFWTQTGWLHLAIVMDLYSRRIIGWSMDITINKELTQNALKMALMNREPKTTVMHHSDQGKEYTNNDYQALLKQHNMVVSMSRKANCHDNAVVESFFKTIKAELARKIKFKTPQEAKSAIFEYIEIFYNRLRMHSTLGYRSPMEFERINSNN